MNGSLKILGLLALGAGIGAATVLLIPGAGPQPSGSQELEPLYWVAPMDPDYRRDGPGKSPMGMDLVPVYAEDAATAAAGTVRISPDVMNNLGVRTDVVRRGVVVREIRTVGYVGFDEDRLVHIHPRVEGWINLLYVKAEGDPVTAGEPLFELYSPSLVNAQEELVLALKRGNTTLIQAALARLRALELPDAMIQALQRTRQVRQTVTLFAPKAGVLETLAVREGMFVEPGLNVMTIGALTSVWVEGEVYERQSLEVAVGDPVEMTLDYLPGRTWHAQVDYVYPSLDEATRTLRFRLNLDNADGALKPGMFADLVVRPVADPVPTLLIPREALIRTERGDRVVLALDEGRFKSVAVTPGRFGPAQVEILDGLETGDRIVTSAQFLIDSESSRTSDFKRMSHNAPERDAHARHSGGMQP